jgi:hypothetical protein
MKVEYKPSTLEIRTLALRGVPGNILRERPFNAEERVRNYTSSSDGLKPVTLKSAKMLEYYQSMVKDPVHAPYSACICSDPNDSSAKYMAAQIALEAYRQKVNLTWHTLIGGYKNELLLDKSARRKTELLIISNVPYNSTELKFEKLRDILEVFSDIPRIVVSTGLEPLALFNEVGLGLNYPIWIRSKRCNRVLGN